MGIGFLILSTVFASLTNVFGVDLNLINDGPAILESNVTFYAILLDVESHGEYVYEFNDNTGKAVKVKSSSNNVSLSLNYGINYRPGDYRMTVNVYDEKFILYRTQIATADTIFTLTDTINGDITSENDKGDDPHHGFIFSTKEEVNMSTELHDPSGFFKNATVQYFWEIGDIRLRGQSVSHNFTQSASIMVFVWVWAFLDTENGGGGISVKQGMFKKKVQALEPVNSINVTGKTAFSHGDVMVLNVSCNGSASFEYCWDIFQTNGTQQNLTCDSSVIHSTSCNFLVMHYFPLPRAYQVAINISNKVGSELKTVGILVYDVSHKPQLSTVIIPVVCSIAALIIVVMGIAYHQHQRHKLIIEVADFDFQCSKGLIEKTFFERLYESIREAFKASCIKKHHEDDKSLPSTSNGIINSQSYDNLP